MRREFHVRFCEGGGVQLSSATRLIVVRSYNQLATATGDLVIAYDLGWRRLWTRRFNNPLSDAETFRVSLSGRLLEIGGKTDQIEAIQGQYTGLLSSPLRLGTAAVCRRSCKRGGRVLPGGRLCPPHDAGVEIRC